MNLHLFPTRKIILGLCALLLPATLALAPAVSLAAERPTQPAADVYDLSWWTADGGGQTFPGQAARTGSIGGNYSLGGTAGQPDAGLLAGPGYHLSGGFWSGATVVYNIYLPVVLRSSP